MSVYTVHQPPQRKTGASADPERFAFVRDGFYFWAMVFGPVWLLWRRLWLVLLLYAIAWIAVEGGLLWIKAGTGAQAAIAFAWKRPRSGAGRSIAAAGNISASSSATIWNPPSGVSSRPGATAGATKRPRRKPRRWAVMDRNPRKAPAM